MNIVKAARMTQDMTQQAFAEWLSDRVGHAVTRPRVAEWESGKRSPRRNIREICAPLAAEALANDAVKAVAVTMGYRAIDDGHLPLPPDLRTTRDDIKEWIIDLLV